MTVLENGGHQAESKPVDVNDPRLSRFDIVREGARRDDIEIVTYESQILGTNYKAEKHVVSIIAFLSLFSGAAALVFLVYYIVWPWEFELGATDSDFFTPILVISLGVSL